MVCCFSKASDGFMQAKSLKSACGLSASNHLNKKGLHKQNWRWVNIGITLYTWVRKKQSKSFFKTHMFNKFYAPNTFWNGWTGHFVHGPWMCSNSFSQVRATSISLSMFKSPKPWPLLDDMLRDHFFLPRPITKWTLLTALSAQCNMYPRQFSSSKPPLSPSDATSSLPDSGNAKCVPDLGMNSTPLTSSPDLQTNGAEKSMDKTKLQHPRQVRSLNQTLDALQQIWGSQIDLIQNLRKGVFELGSFDWNHLRF